jgi:poly(3-hydroxybutyrate) depolymerase
MASRRTSSRRVIATSAGLLLAAGLGWQLAHSDDQTGAGPLPALAIDVDRVALFGISSGAYMAQQLHIAHSSRFIGAALVAGGPYGCAEGDLGTALARCMNPADDALPEIDALAQEIRARAQAGSIDPLDGLAGDRVHVFHGQLDETVGAGVSLASAALYDALAAEVEMLSDFDQPVGHLLPTVGEGSCAVTASPWLAACELDLAGQLMRHLFQVDQPAAAAAMGDEFPAGLADEGYLYVPPQCNDGGCGLLLALHGCQQTAANIGTAFVEGAGFQRWADSAGVVVLYPQTAASMIPLNPKACWDWWGYSGSNYDTREGPQIKALMAYVDALSAPRGAP